MSHTFFIVMSYGIAAGVVLCLIAWIWLDGLARQRELDELAASGIRRSAKAAPGHAGKAP